MKAYAEMGLRDAGRARTEQQKKGIGYYFDVIRKAIGKCVTLQKDVVFTDPNWPYLWDHKSSNQENGLSE